MQAHANQQHKQQNTEVTMGGEEFYLPLPLIVPSLRWVMSQVAIAAQAASSLSRVETSSTVARREPDTWHGLPRETRKNEEP